MESEVPGARCAPMRQPAYSSRASASRSSRAKVPFSAVLTLLVASRASAGAPPPPAAESIGAYNKDGALVAGVALAAEGPDHYLLYPAACYARPEFAAAYPDASTRDNFFGHPVVVAAIVEVAAAVRAKLAASGPAPRLPVGEIGHATGGLIPHHLSHQNGLDADIYFFQRPAQAGADSTHPVPLCEDGARFEREDPTTHRWSVSPDFEHAWTWALAAAFAARDDVQVIFIGGLLKASLGDWAKAHGVPAPEHQRTLAKLLTVACSPPRGVKVPFYKNNFCPHDDHFHVRFKCPRTSKRCVGPRAPR